MMTTLLVTLGLLAMVSAGPGANKDANSQGYKDQYCTDPRTMRKHAAYTEWADAYSCTRHRCQPGGRNLAIYTVGCKRVEAPESAIECEEVVEDTNMQFPFCCTRLRCLVVVRGEVWTRVLGQPWEVLPAAPWSHMYKMKKPPPTDTAFQSKANEQGPVYELSEPENEGGHDKVLRSARKQASTDSPDCNEVVPRAALPPAPAPDIVIALSTNNEKDMQPKKPEASVRHKRGRKSPEPSHYFEREDERDHHETDMEMEETPAYTEKVSSYELRERRPRIFTRGREETVPPPSGDGQQPPESSDETMYANTFGLKDKQSKGSHHQISWTEIPQNQWNEHEGMDVEPRANVMELRYTQEPAHSQNDLLHLEPVEKVDKKEEKVKKSNNLQALVDAIGTRMRDIENVVHRMSEKVHQTKSPFEGSAEKRTPGDGDYSKAKHELIHHKSDMKEPQKSKHDHLEPDDHFKQRFAVRNLVSKYINDALVSTSEQPLYVEDNGNYFSDASNVVRRANQPKEPAQSHPTYMAPVESHRRSPAHIAMVSDTSEDQERKKKKHTHKKRKGKAHAHKKHHNQDKRKHFNKLSSAELEKNVVSLEDSSALNNK